jgi:cytoskeletal protein CcmA (bactofilin family)
MFLTSLTRRLTARRDDDQGMAMVAVIGLMAVGVIVTAVIGSTLAGSLSFTSATRASVQSQASAEAGIAAARAGLIAGTCVSRGGVYENSPGATPVYMATVWVPSGSSWTRGCPTTLTQQVRILSTGESNQPAVGTADFGDETSLEAVLSSVAVSSGTVASGPAVYAYNSTGFGGSGTLVSFGGSAPSVLVKTGNVTCSGASAGTADWVVDNGTLSISGSCAINGNVWASGRLTMSGNVPVSGNAVAAGISVSGSSRILGNAWSTADTVLSGGGTYIGGNVTSQSLTMDSSTGIRQNAWITGATSMTWGSTIDGRLTTRSLTRPNGAGSIGALTVVPSGPGASPYLTPPRPLVPNWVDFAYRASDWTGQTIVTLSTCSVATYTSALATIGSNRGVIDARACSNGFVLGGNNKLAMRNDLAVIANKFDLGGSGGFTSTAAAQLRLIIPDSVDNDLPTCPTGGAFGIGGGFSFQTTISTMIYTPCAANIASGLYIKGQLFAGQASLGGSATIAYVPIGLPNVNLSTGESSAGGAETEADRTLVSLRNVQASN